jgi:formylmethanofuran--tetrahydromethanopterin N-formyltransferase
MNINGVEIEDTFAEAFDMRVARVVVTAETSAWAQTAATVATGYSTSIIGCDAEAGVETELAPDQTPDGRVGVSMLFFGSSRAALAKALLNRLGQCVMTCATTACFDGLPTAAERVNVGGRLRFFGDGYQASKKLGDRRYWRVPVMDGEFVCEETFGVQPGIAGGNVILLGVDAAATLDAAEAAVAAMRRVPGVVLPFPGGIARSGSKVGSRYKGLRASTNDAHCPTLRALAQTALPGGVNAAYEIVINGLDLGSVEAATAQGVRAACGRGVVRITAGNYGGKLGPYKVRLHRVLGDSRGATGEREAQGRA